MCSSDLSLPLMAGNLFQQLYNTVDSIVVGNFVGKEALAAVGSVGPIAFEHSYQTRAITPKTDRSGTAVIIGNSENQIFHCNRNSPNKGNELFLSQAFHPLLLRTYVPANGIYSTCRHSSGMSSGTYVHGESP